jgi:hypothetical protein
MENISNRALISRLFSSTEEQLEGTHLKSNDWKQWYETIEQFTAPEKMVYLMVKMNQTVTNGGFAEFYSSSMGIFTPEIVHVCQEIKADATAEIVSNSLPIVNPIGLLDNEYKAFVFNISLTEHQRSQLLPLDIRYDQLQDIENLEDLLGNYLQEMIK